jgi:hypothetical protein
LRITKAALKDGPDYTAPRLSQIALLLSFLAKPTSCQLLTYTSGTAAREPPKMPR